jgi:1-acyl-sn-glycerol-3-phosphate acyltransferase
MALAGLFLGYLLCLPLFFLARHICSLQKPTERFFASSIRTVMNLQPWLNIECDLREWNTLRENTRRPILLLANHRSHLDMFLLLSFIPGLHSLSKRQLLRFWPLAPFLKVTKQILIDSKNLGSFIKSLDEARDRARSGQNILIFPEFTRCAPGFHGIGPLNRAVFKMARDAKALVVPIMIQGTDVAWPKNESCFHPVSHVSIRALPALDADVFTSSEALMHATRAAFEGAFTGQAP